MRALLAPLLAFALPVLVFAVDYRYFGPVVRFGPFIAWTAAALGMVGYAAGLNLRARPFLSGICCAFLAGGTLLAGCLALIFLPIVLIAASLVFTGMGLGLIGTALVYARRLAAALRSRPPTGAWRAGLAVGAIIFVGLPALAQELHNWRFQQHLAGLSAADPLVRAHTLRSLVGSRFCWRACTRAVCEARADLDAETVKAVLGVRDVDLECEHPDLGEWPG